MESKPMGMMTMYDVRVGIQKAIRKFETDEKLGDLFLPFGLELAIGGYLALLKTYEIEIDYRRSQHRTKPIEFFDDDASQQDDGWLCKEHDDIIAHSIFKPRYDDELEDE